MTYFSGNGIPERGRILIVNFELGGKAVPPEMCKPGRPCVVVQNNKLDRGPLLTLIPLSTKAPNQKFPHHHLMDHRSFRLMPADYGGQTLERWAKCDHLLTVSRDRCTDPYSRDRYDGRKYVKLKIIQADMLAIERAILWGLGIQPGNHVPTPAVVVDPG
jgi:uncharacterized protein YifN (PemK superfamily)